MRLNATLDEIWKRVKEETPSGLRGKVFGSMAEIRGYSIKQINDHLDIVSPGEDEYIGENSLFRDKATIPDTSGYGSVKPIDLTSYLSGKSSDVNDA